MGFKNCLLCVCGTSMLIALVSCVSNVEEELYPPDTCDTTQVTYSATIAPIIELNCYECHGGEATISGIPLEGYANLKAVVDEGRLVGAVRHEDGYSAMPKDAQALPECQLLQIEKWVDEGAPDN
jgi:mono/diheme cytochrome c family protein